MREEGEHAWGGGSVNNYYSLSESTSLFIITMTDQAEMAERRVLTCQVRLSKRCEQWERRPPPPRARPSFLETSWGWGADKETVSLV